MDCCTIYWAFVIEDDNPIAGYLNKLAKDVWESDDEDMKKVTKEAKNDKLLGGSRAEERNHSPINHWMIDEIPHMLTIFNLFIMNRKIQDVETKQWHIL